TTDMVVGGLINTVDATSDLTSSLRDDKLVLDARDDAARFVASQGDLRGAHLEAALRHIRSQQLELGASDLQLAQAILAL
ncbi:MAG TPA: holliday junction resolvasome, helicase subunit, partial [Pseudomonas sp.]|nr:holliday junction resolvasome, helicase subunit [Pseudomonas sp.]